MTLIVESGVGLSDSECFCSVAFADKYHADRGNDDWDAVDNKEAAIRKGADYMQQTYRLRWAGYRKTDTQAMDWPRYDMPRIDSIGFGGSFNRFGGYASYYPSDSVPREVAQANAEFALRASSGELAEDLEANVKSEAVGPIEVVYQDNATQQKRYPAIDRLLAPYLSAGGSSIKLVRG
jgi:hypothetical protein